MAGVNRPPSDIARCVDLVSTLLRARWDDAVRLDAVPGMALFLDSLRFAAEQGVAPALADGLRRAAAGGAWAGLQPFLDDVERRNRERNAELLAAAVAASQRLAAAGIEAVLLKGVAVAAADPAGAPWRTLTDIDLLVAAEAVPEAAGLLEADGYRSLMAEAAYHPDYHHHHAGLYSDDRDALIELHGRLTKERGRDPLGYGAIRAAAETVRVGGAEVLVPCPEHRMFHLVAHAQIGNLGYALRQVTLKDVVDAVELAHARAVDWAAVAHAFAVAGAGRELAGFAAAVRRIAGVGLGPAGGGGREAEAWAGAAIGHLTRPAPGWRTMLWLGRHYAASFLRQPRRLAMIRHTLAEPARLRLLLSVTRTRLGRPD